MRTSYINFKRLRVFFRSKINSLNQNTFDLLVSASVPHRWIISFFYTTTTPNTKYDCIHLFLYSRTQYRIIYFAMIIQYQIKENINLLKLPKDMCLVIHCDMCSIHEHAMCIFGYRLVNNSAQMDLWLHLYGTASKIIVLQQLRFWFNIRFLISSALESTCKIGISSSSEQ